MSMTQSKGVHVVLNSLADDKLKVPLGGRVTAVISNIM